MEDFVIRDGAPDDLADIDRLYPDAFPDEELRPLVRSLLCDTPGVLSLVAAVGARLVGHVAFTRCRVTGGGDAVALLAPLAVASTCQKRGIGSALVRAGLDRQRSAGVGQVFVLGDPAYYGRFGFEPEQWIAPPFPLPEEWHDAWRSVTFDVAAPTRRGVLDVPEAWNDPALWSEG